MTSAVVRVTGAGAEIVALDPGGETAPIGERLLERALQAAKLAPGLWRVDVEGGDPARVATRALGAEDAHVVVARVERTGPDSVVVREVKENPAGALDTEALARRVSDAVAAVTGDLPVGQPCLVEMVA